MNLKHFYSLLFLTFYFIYLYLFIFIFIFSLSFYFILLGVTHNIPLLRDILTEERFIKGDINTKYLPEVGIPKITWS